MKVLIFSDLHLHNWQYGSTVVDGMNSRLRDQARVLDQIAMYCEYNEVDHIVFGGDLFHTHGKIDASVLKVAYEGITNLLEKSNVGMDIIVGNHDTACKDMSTHALHWLAMHEQIRIMDHNVHNNIKEEWFEASFLPYTEDKDRIKKFFENANPLCFTHQGMSGVPMGSGFVINEILTQDMVPSHIKHLFTGHYHKHTEVTDRITIIGSAMQLTWADEGDKRGFLVYDTEDGKFEHIESVAPKFVTIDWNSLIVPPASLVENNFIKITNYTGHHPDDIRDFVSEAGARSVEFTQNKDRTTSLKPLSTCAGFHLPSVVDEYEKQKEVTPECSKVGKELMK